MQSYDPIVFYGPNKCKLRFFPLTYGSNSIHQVNLIIIDTISTIIIYNRDNQISWAYSSSDFASGKQLLKAVNNFIPLIRKSTPIEDMLDSKEYKQLKNLIIFAYVSGEFIHKQQ